VITIAGDGQIHGLGAQLEVGADVDVVQASDRQFLQQLAVKVIGQQALFFVGAKHAAFGRGVGVNPDRRIIRRITLAADWVGLAHGGDFRQYRICRYRLGLPVELALVERAAVVVAYQQLLAVDAQLLGFFQARQAQARLFHPALARPLEQVKLRSLWIERDHATRHQGDGTGFTFGIIEHRHRGAFHVRFRVRRVGPPADIFFIDYQLIRPVVHLAELRRWWQRQTAHTLGFSQQRRAIAHQPLLALALLTHQKHKQVGR